MKSSKIRYLFADIVCRPKENLNHLSLFRIVLFKRVCADLSPSLNVPAIEVVVFRDLRQW